MTPDPVSAVRRVIVALESLGLTYCIGGSLASSIYGPPRSTNDADLVVALRPEHIAPLVAALEHDFMIDLQAMLPAIAGERSFNVIAFDTLDRVDVFVVAAQPWPRQQLARRRLETLAEEPDAPALFFSSPEDVILSKLNWYRRGGEVSDRQWVDLLGVLATRRAELDWAYLRRWADELGVADLLARAVASVDQDGARE